MGGHKRGKSSNSSGGSPAQTKDGFEKHCFEGNRMDYEQLEQCIKTSVLNQYGDNGYQLLFPTTSWVYDTAGALNANVATEKSSQLGGEHGGEMEQGAGESLY